MDGVYGQPPEFKTKRGTRRKPCKDFLENLNKFKEETKYGISYERN